MASVFFFAIMTSAIMSILAVKYLCKFMFYFPALGYILRNKILESECVFKTFDTYCLFAVEDVIPLK